MPRVLIGLGVILSAASATPAAAQAVASGAGPSPKEAHVWRVVGTAPQVDGRLDEPAWRSAEWFSDFVQKEPAEGAEPLQRTEVAFLYDDQALYVAARMAGVTPWDVPSPVGRRDQGGNAEHFIVILDPFLDRRTGYAFAITSGGVRADWYHPGDSEGQRDFGFDPVWQAGITRDSVGWTAEMRIPFSQLRFRHGGSQRWGLNINRWMPARNEDVYWVMIPKNETGFISRFGTLTGIEGVRPSRRLELMPYAASEARYTSAVDPRDPFEDGSRYRASAGLDLKMGLGPNLTLDAAVNPDFGQVEADPAEVNLSAFETFFPERRPFFTEGAALLRGNGPGYFYSRRIGAPPLGEATGDFLDQPQNSTILGASKATGRLGSGLSVGALAAVTDDEWTRTYDSTSGTRGRTRVAPLTGYGVARVQQEFGPATSTVGFMLAGVERDVADGSRLAAAYSRRAWSGGADWLLRFQGGKYELGGFAGFSHVAGDSARILALQTASQRYYQRPDQHYLTLDPSRRSLSGYTGGLWFAKNAGRHWLYNAQVGAESPGFELNDAGRLSASDDIDLFANLVYRETRPGALFHRWSARLNASANYDYGGERQGTFLSLGFSQTWKGYQGSGITAFYRPRFLSDNLTRGGPLMGAPAGWGGEIEFESGEAGNTRGDAAGRVEWDEFGGWSVGLEAGLSTRPTPRLQLALIPEWGSRVNPRQYLMESAGGGAATYGTRYLFGWIDQTTISTRLRLSYALGPDLTLEGYLESFAASGRYTRLGELRAARSRSLRRYGSDGTTISRQADRGYLVTDNAGADTVRVENPDFNVLSFRGNLVLRWEWRRGSTLFLVWQQNREAAGGLGTRARPGDLWDALKAGGQQFLALKISYWIPAS
jgi:hypothetical protein